MDKIFGCAGLRRGRIHPSNLSPGDGVNFIRVLYVKRQEGRLLLSAEMKLPGEAWLEFKITTATFRPKGLSRGIYCHSILPFCDFIFNEMLNKLAN